MDCARVLCIAAELRTKQAVCCALCRESSSENGSAGRCGRSVVAPDSYLCVVVFAFAGKFQVVAVCVSTLMISVLRSTVSVGVQCHSARY